MEPPNNGHTCNWDPSFCPLGGHYSIVYLYSTFGLSLIRGELAGSIPEGIVPNCTHHKIDVLLGDMEVEHIFEMFGPFFPG